MGGQGSGGHNRLSDDEKKARGTFRADQSAAAHDARQAAKIFGDEFLANIPEPDFPLTDIGRAKYDEWANELFEQRKLTKIAATRAAALALQYQKIHRRASEGKEISDSTQAKFQSGLRDLNIAQNAEITATPGRNPFEGCGFALSRNSPFRLRPSTPADPGEHADP